MTRRPERYRNVYSRGYLRGLEEATGNLRSLLAEGGRVAIAPTFTDELAFRLGDEVVVTDNLGTLPVFLERHRRKTPV